MNLLAGEIIRRKRDGEVLSEAEIEVQRSAELGVAAAREAEGARLAALVSRHEPRQQAPPTATLVTDLERQKAEALAREAYEECGRLTAEIKRVRALLAAAPSQLDAPARMPRVHRNIGNAAAAYVVTKAPGAGDAPDPQVCSHSHVVLRFL